MKTKELNWKVGYSQREDILPQNRVPAHVPGAVQLDWAKAHEWPDYTYGDNYKAYLWMEDVYWSYVTTLEFDEPEEDQSIYFVCKGIDYKFKIKLNGKIIHEQEGMFTPFEIDLTGIAHSGDELEVLVFPAPKREGAPIGRSQADESCKPAVSYGWDWHPRLVPLGIWDDTYLEVRNSFHIKEAKVNYVLNEDFSEAEVFLDVQFSESNKGKVEWEVADEKGNVVFKLGEVVSSANMVLSHKLKNPQLWWPHDQGEPVLYLNEVRLYDEATRELDRKTARIGFRRVHLVMHPGAWHYPEGFPKSRSNPPITMEINGRSIFCKGSNWVNPEIFPGIITEKTYAPLLTMAKEANMNLLRVWGGGIINKESFYDICDEAGIMVWQEFPLACNNYRDVPHYLKVLDQESRSIIKRLSPHASLVLWCGGNELFNGWSGMTEQSLALRLLNRNCFDLDPYRPFLMTSPLMGMGHGNYLFKYHNGEEVFQAMPKADNTAYTEFGCPGPSPEDYIRKFIPQEELFPPRPGTAWEHHHAFNAWVGDTWLVPGQIEEYFGKQDTLEGLVECGQLLQSEGYKCIFEEARRQKPRCSMALNWCYNEPWPTAANNSLINWPAQPKRAYYAVAASCRPVLASARIPKFSWKEGEIFNPELWLLNDAPVSLPAGRMKVYLKMGEEEFHLLTWDYPEIPENTNVMGPVIRFKLPSADCDRMMLILKVENMSPYDSEYTLLYQRTSTGKLKGGARVLNI